jgi:hypothetical protein
VKPSLVLGIALAAIAVLDVILGLTIVLPRTPEKSQPILRAAFLGGAVVILAFAAALLTGILEV